MRVIAGQFRSRTLQTLPGDATRPTYDRLKETLFNVLGAAGLLDGATFVDLFAGIGSIGIEALSRGAERVYFAENDRKAAGLIRKNLQSLGLEAAGEVYERTAADVIRQLDAAGIRGDIVFLDPPYAMHGAYEQTLRLLSGSRLLSPESVVVAEHDKRFDPGDGVGDLRRYRRLNQGESSLSFYRKSAINEAEEPSSHSLGPE